MRWWKRKIVMCCGVMVENTVLKQWDMREIAFGVPGAHLTAATKNSAEWQSSMTRLALLSQQRYDYTPISKPMKSQTIRLRRK